VFVSMNSRFVLRLFGYISDHGMVFSCSSLVVFLGTSQIVFPEVYAGLLFTPLLHSLCIPSFISPLVSVIAIQHAAHFVVKYFNIFFFFILVVSCFFKGRWRLQFGLSSFSC